MKNYQLDAVVRRDLLLFFRTSWFFLPLALIQLLVMQYTTLSGILKANMPTAIQNAIIAGLMGYAPTMVVPFFGNLFLNKSISEERLRQTLVRTLVTGIKPGALWWTKFALAACLSYLVVLVCEVILWGIAWFYTGKPVELTASDLINILLVNPVSAIAILAIMGLLHWAFKRPGMALMFIPMIVMFGSWMLSASNPLTPLFSPLTAAAFLLGSIGIIVICGLISAKLSKERIAGLY